MNKFKNTEIGEIPADWDVQLLGEIADIEAGGNAPQGEQYFNNGSMPFVRVQHFDGTRKYIDRWDLINHDAVRECRLKLFPTGSILFPKSGASINLEKRAKLPCDAYVVGHLAVANPHEGKCDSDFLYFLLRHLRLGADSSGSTLPFLNISFINSKKIAVPGKSEQEKIAGALSRIQKAVENQEKLVADLRELKAATAFKLFHEGLKGEHRKQTEIGEMPHSWILSSLKDVCAETQTNNPSKTPDKTIEYVDVSSVSRAECRITSSTKYLGKDAPGRARNLVQHRDVIFATVRPTLRRVAIIPPELAGQLVSTAFCVIRAIEPKAYSEYLYYVVSSNDFVARVGRLERGANYPAVTDANIFSQMIALPGYEEQKEIAAALHVIEENLKTAVKKHAELKFLFSSTLNQLMAGKVRIS